MSDNFVINWGNAKELVVPEDGVYELEIAEYEILTPKKKESAEHGFNIYIKFRIVDGEELGISDKFRVHHWIYFDVDNPWAAKLFFEALVGSELNGDEIDPRNTSQFIGERVRAACVQESYDKTDDDGNVLDTKTTLKAKTFLPA